MFSDLYKDYFLLSRHVITILLSVPLTVMGYYIYAKKNIYALTLSNTVFHIIRIGLNVTSVYFYGLVGAYSLQLFYDIALTYVYLGYIP